MSQELVDRITSILLGIILGYVISELAILYCNYRKRKDSEQQRLLQILKRK